MIPNDPTSWLQLGIAGAALLYLLVRVERALGSVAKAQSQTNLILMLLLKKSGVADEEALKLIDKGAKGESSGLYTIIGSLLGALISIWPWRH